MERKTEAAACTEAMMIKFFRFAFSIVLLAERETYGIFPFQLRGAKECFFLCRIFFSSSLAECLTAATSNSYVSALNSWILNLLLFYCLRFRRLKNFTSSKRVSSRERGIPFSSSFARAKKRKIDIFHFTMKEARRKM